MQLAPQPRPSRVTLWVNEQKAGEHEIAAGRPQVLVFELAVEQPAGVVAECRMECDTFCPATEGMGLDHRDLGLHVASIAIR